MGLKDLSCVYDAVKTPKGCACMEEDVPLNDDT
jgi:hypothetical protein